VRAGSPAYPDIYTLVDGPADGAHRGGATGTENLTPCASCQKLIGAHLVGLAERSNKLAIFRGSAQQVYESAPGRLGTALHQVKTGTKQHDRSGPAHIKDVLGVHLTI